jgi:tetratricopeptide (TPR) repeat protein
MGTVMAELHASPATAPEALDVQQTESTSNSAADSSPTQKWTSWRRVRRWAKWVFGLLATFSGIIVASLFIWQLADLTLRRRGLDLQSFEVPKDLADSGFTGSVVARRLRDALDSFYHGATTSMQKTSIKIHQDAPDITIPKTGISVEPLAAFARDFLPTSWRHEVTGEFTKDGNQISLRLRLNGQAIFMSKGNAESSTEVIDQLIQKGAFELIRATQPYIAAAFKFSLSKHAEGKARTDSVSEAEAEADRIIATLPPDDENVVRAYSLKGLIADSEHKEDKAKAFYNMAINLSATHLNLDSNLALSLAAAHVNLGQLLYRQGRTDAAITEYIEALRLDYHYSVPHFNLAQIWKTKGDINRALREYRYAIRFDPTDPDAHYQLARVFAEKQRFDQASAEYLAAIRYNQADPWPHFGLGAVYYGQKKLHAAIDQFTRGIELNSDIPVGYYDLALAYFDLARSSAPTDSNKPEYLRNACIAILNASSHVDSSTIAYSNYLELIGKIDAQMDSNRCQTR